MELVTEFLRSHELGTLNKYFPCSASHKMVHIAGHCENLHAILRGLGQTYLYERFPPGKALLFEKISTTLVRIITIEATEAEAREQNFQVPGLQSEAGIYSVPQLLAHLKTVETEPSKVPGAAEWHCRLLKHYGLWDMYISTQNNWR